MRNIEKFIYFLKAISPVLAIFYLVLTFVRGTNSLRPKSDTIEKIASLNLASDEILVEILQEARSLHKLKAVSTLADQEKYSYLAKETLAKIPHRSNTQIENLIALKPNIVFAASFNRLSLVTPLKEAGIKVHTLTSFDSLQSIYHNYNKIGEAIGLKEVSTKITRTIKEDINFITQKYPAPKKGQYILIWLADGTCVGSDTLINDVVEQCGAKNLLVEQGMKGWQKLSLEKLALMQPKWLLTVGDPKKKKLEIERLKKTPLIKDMYAVKKGKVIIISQREMSTQSSFITKTIQHVCSRLNREAEL